MPHKGLKQIFFNEINSLDRFQEKNLAVFSLQMRHLARALKVTPEGMRQAEKIGATDRFGAQPNKRPLHEGPGTAQESQCQSPNIFCLSSRRCCASSDRVAVGRASSRPTPMGSPVSSQ